MTHSLNCQISDEINVPDTLFHYTSLESLACILSNRSLRLMPLSGLDDPQESKTVDAPGIGAFHYVSCWTDDKTESIPMWNMYASLQSGVRIELVNDPFERYKYSASDFERALNMPAGHAHFDGSTVTTFLPLEDILEYGYSVSFLNGNNVLRRVEYTSDHKKLVPRMVSVANDQMNVDLGKIAKYKNEYWAFQHEWRYVLNFLPLNPFDISGNLEKRMAAAVGTMLSGTNAQPMPFYDLHISDEALCTMRIVPSPKMTPGNRVLLEHLLNAYNMSSNIKYSELTGLL